KKIDNPTQDTDVIFETASELFDKVWKREPLRLIGVATSQLQKDPVEQFSMFDFLPRNRKDKLKLNRSIDKIREKYGNEYIIRGSLLNLKNQRSPKNR
ncbi:MAG: DNA polymerase IV, partial [Clostridiaceae bacterium]|nr:DNA polymerase IV [Clostridiaceae bacterium]